MDHFEKQQEFLRACQNLDLSEVDFTSYHTDGFNRVCSALYSDIDSDWLINRGTNFHLLTTVSDLRGFPDGVLALLSEAYSAKEWQYAVKCLELYFEMFLF